MWLYYEPITNRCTFGYAMYVTDTLCVNERNGKPPDMLARKVDVMAISLGLS